MGDDIGVWNIGAYHRGMMTGRTPNLDKIARRGHAVTDYYAEASCTRAAPPSSRPTLRSAPHDHGRPGRRSEGRRRRQPRSGPALKSLGYATGQFGKNHLGDKNDFPPPRPLRRCTASTSSSATCTTSTR